MHHTVKTYGKVEVWFHAFLTSPVDENEWSDLRPGHFVPGGSPVTHQIGGSLGRRARLDAVMKKIEPRSSSLKSSYYTYRTILRGPQVN
jgi:hypothetical protein